ncbi:hypothetical protein [Paenibacillus sp. GYB003]|uniref:hypothetical protein n=1 Tax=Paenibacillus sp. GYB003 TaxID=2994392 RepID=UPI002F9699AF
MNTQHWRSRLSKLRKPGYCLLLAVCAGIAVNVLIVSYKLMPLFQERVVFNLQYNQLEKQLAAMESSPIPEPASEPNIEKLVRQVPTKEEIASFLVSLKEIERQSGVVLKSIQFGGDKTNGQPDDLMAFIQNQLKSSQPSAGAADGTNAAPPASPAPAPAPQTNRAAPAGVPFQETKATIVGTGAYAQVVDLFDRLHRLERIVSITGWQIDPAGETGPSGQPLLQAALTIVLYSAGQYAETFPALPAIPTSPPGPKPSPIVADELYWNMLQSTKSK